MCVCVRACVRACVWIQCVCVYVCRYFVCVFHLYRGQEVVYKTSLIVHYLQLLKNLPNLRIHRFRTIHVQLYIDHSHVDLASSKIATTSPQKLSDRKIHLQQLSSDLRGYAPRSSLPTQSKVSCMFHKQSIDISHILLIVIHTVQLTLYFWRQGQHECE